MASPLGRIYRTPALSPAALGRAVTAANAASLGATTRITSASSEFVFYVQREAELTPENVTALTWLIAETFEPASCRDASFLSEATPGTVLVEVGPRLNFTSAFSTNATSICRSAGVPVARLERYRRFLLVGEGDTPPSAEAIAAFTSRVHDRMTEWRVSSPLVSFDTGVTPAPVTTFPVCAGGAAVLERANKDLGLSLDARDIEYLLSLFRDDMQRDPTDVELFDFSQSNSEHSRHWFFRGALVVDGIPIKETLMDIVRETLSAQPGNSVVAFADNSSAITGFPTALLLPDRVGLPTSFSVRTKLRHLLLTAETHNFPTGIAPFPGAETGTGGRIRDSHATGKGSYAIAGTAGYCVGALQIPGHALPWEDASLVYPRSLAPPLQIIIDASSGASDYGNKFGEPVVTGFARSVSLLLSGSGERREYLKPIMFTAGVGAIDDEHSTKGDAGVGMVVVKLGGPAYRIGMGGSAASSMMQGENAEARDFNAVQRGDAEMEQKVNRVIRASCEMGDRNPIISIHDQGAGGNCNVLKEIVAPSGGRIDVRKIIVGDDTLSVLEIWGAEYQEADALLLSPSAVPAFTALCARERVPVAFVGHVTDDKRIVLFDSRDGSSPVDLDLDRVLGKMPQKVFPSTRVTAPAGAPLVFHPDVDTRAALERVLRLLSVGSKRFLTNKVDRSVTGLIAQQQCVGPLHTPLADCAVIALSHCDVAGIASSIGEQPVKGLGNTAAGARMSVGEAITNLCAARITSLTETKCSANWMWAAKLPHEGAALFDACRAMADFMIAVGVAVDGGKDSLSMATVLPTTGEIVKAPGTLVISLYAPCPDVRLVLTPDLKAPGSSELIFVDLSARLGAPRRNRCGGSALAQVYGQVGLPTDVPDCEDPSLLVDAFEAVQALMATPLASGILSYHDRSDGGLVCALLEMAFSGDCGFDVDIPASASCTPLETLFAEELGMVLEVGDGHVSAILAALHSKGVSAASIGRTTVSKDVELRIGGAPALARTHMPVLRDVWESTSFALEKLQANPVCVAAEQASMATRSRPAWHLSYVPHSTAPERLLRSPAAKPRFMVLREEGTNGDRELTSALWGAGIDAWDVTMTDLLSGAASLSDFRGIAFPGGFSYGDVLDSAKGWAGTITHNKGLLAQFSAFYARPDTLSLGICNGCQLMALLGWVPFGPGGVPDAAAPRFVHNQSERFESRFSTVRVAPSPAVMLRGMEGSVLGVWVAHGEGRAHFPDAALRARVSQGSLAPLLYADDAGAATEAYPFNPNGSPGGIAALCSSDGRHLAMMPHPERVARLWQWPWMPRAWEAELVESPWARLFQNAAAWCEGGE